jgi:hypothetical protein
MSGANDGCSTLTPAVPDVNALTREWPELAFSARSMAEPQGLVSLADPTFDSREVVVNFGLTGGVARAGVRVQPASSAKRNFG